MQEAKAKAWSDSSTAGLSTAGMGHVNGIKTIDMQDNLTAMGTCSLVRGEEMFSGESGGSNKDQGICSLLVGPRDGQTSRLTPRKCPAEAQSATLKRSHE